MASMLSACLIYGECTEHSFHLVIPIHCHGCASMHNAYTYFYSQITLAPSGVQAYMMDIEAFHHTFSILPSQNLWLVVQGRAGTFYIDHNHLFGAACACSNAGMIASAIVDIWEEEGVDPVLKYKDDLKVFHISLVDGASINGEFHYDYDHEDMLHCIKHLSVPWHSGKGDIHFTFITNFIGYLWDISQKTVSLPEAKCLKFQECVCCFLNDFCDSHHPCIRKIASCWSGWSQ